MTSLSTCMRHMAAAALIAVCLLLAVVPASAQVQQWQNTANYGVTGFKMNGMLVASRFNYQVFSGPNTGGGFANFQNFSNGCFMDIGGNIRILPFNTNATVTVTDTSTSANTETVALSAITTNAAPICTLSLSTSNAHTGGYILSSGTCGLKEAQNFIGATAGTILVNQEFYDQGCTAATITGVTTGLRANVNVYDNTTGIWYTAQPSVLTALATPATRSATAGATQVISGTAVGTWPASTEFVCVTYVDILGGESPCSASFSFTATASVALNFAAPAASTGAVGWRAYAGLTGTSTQYQLPISATTCTLSTLTPYPTCAMGAAGVFPTPTTATSLAPGQVTAVYRPNTQSHTAFAYAPSGTAPSACGYQTNYGPFLATVGGTTTQVQVLGTVPLCSAALNTIYRAVRVHGHITMTAGTSETPVLKVQLGGGANFTTGTPTNECQYANTTALSAAVYSLNFTCTLTVNATGATGTVMPDGMAVVALGAGTTAGTAMPELGTAAITTDLTPLNTIYVTYIPTSGTDTAVQLLDLHIEYVN